MKTIKMKDFENCLKVIIDHCEQSCGFWTGESFSEYVSLSSNLQALKVVSAKGLVAVSYADGKPYALTLLDDGRTYFMDKRAERVQFVKNFFSNFFSGFLSGVLFTVLGGLLLQYLTNK